jgi:Bacterial Ig-like domain (group 3)
VGFIADLDGDGNTDLAFLASEQAADSTLPIVTVLVVEYGDGTGGFSATQVIPLLNGDSSVTPLNLTSGALPGFALDDGTNVSVVRNLGGRQFSNEKIYNPSLSIGIVPADFNGNGLSDVLVTRDSLLSSPAPASSSFTVLFDVPGATANGEALSNGELAANLLSVGYNQPFTLTAMIEPAEAGLPTATGTVSFSTITNLLYGPVQLGSAQLASGSAPFGVAGTTTQQFPPGIVQIDAVYSGDSTYAASEMTTTLLVENPQYATTTSLALTSGGNAATSIQAGSFLTMTATVTAPLSIPHGVIAFFDGSTVLGQAEIASDGASFTTNLLAPGTHNLSAQYMGYVPPNSFVGTDTFLPSSSAPTALTVTSIPTATTLNASSSTIASGAVLTLNAQVTSGSGTPIGGVTFYDGTTVLGTFTLDSSGQANFSTASLSIGSHSFSAQYALNSPWAASTSAPVSVTVQASATGLEPTQTIIAAVTPGSNSTLWAAIQVSGAPVAQGAVTLLVDGQIEATLPLTSDGVLSIPVQLQGTTIHHLVASYSGSTVAAPSASPQFETTSYLPGQNFTLQSDQIVAMIPSSGSSAAVTLRVGSVGNWSGTISLSCEDGLPPGYSCVFSSATLTGPGAVTLTLAPQSGLAAFGLVLIPGLCFLRRTGRGRAWVAVILLASLTILSGCSNFSGPQSAKSWVITVQATSGGTLHSTQVEFRSVNTH